MNGLRSLFQHWRWAVFGLALGCLLPVLLSPTSLPSQGHHRLVTVHGPSHDLP